MQVLRDENTALKATVDQTLPTDASGMASLHEQLCKDIASGAWIVPLPICCHDLAPPCFYLINRHLPHFPCSPDEGGKPLLEGRATVGDDLA